LVNNVLNFMNLTQDIRQEKCSIELEQIEQRAYVLARLNEKVT